MFSLLNPAFPISFFSDVRTISSDEQMGCSKAQVSQPGRAARKNSFLPTAHDVLSFLWATMSCSIWLKFLLLIPPYYLLSYLRTIFPLQFEFYFHFLLQLPYSVVLSFHIQSPCRSLNLFPVRILHIYFQCLFSVADEAAIFLASLSANKARVSLPSLRLVAVWTLKPFLLGSS